MPHFPEEQSRVKIAALKRKEEEDNTRLLAERHDLPYIDLSKVAVETDAIAAIPESAARLAQMVVFQKIGSHLKIGVRHPRKEETLTALKKLRRTHICELHLISESSFAYALTFYTHAAVARPFESGQIQVSQEKILTLRYRIHNINDTRKELAAAFASRITDALEVILAGALAVTGSDVHIEPHETSSRLRFRIDGILRDIAEIPPRLAPLLLSRIKLIAEMKLNIRDEPQDGHFTLHIGNDEIEVRVSLLPGPNGENIVLRILDPKSIRIGFAELGLQPWIVDQMRAQLKKTKGMILTTGPTGSGKTTTLYSFLTERSSPEIKIITIEDPIEYRIPGIEQTQISSETGYTFANGLRSIVRQDPDVVLVGEIRDHDTAEAAMHAALTGHLVFSTLHTNNAAGTIPRLVDLGVAPAIIAPAINVIMAQRLIRKLCAQCRILSVLSAEEKKVITGELRDMPDSVPKPPETEWKIYKPPQEKKCPACHMTGYRGRIGIFEILLASHEFERLIIQKPVEIDIRNEMHRQGQITMRQDGILKILSGVTDLAELNRVVNE